MPMEEPRLRGFSWFIRQCWKCKCLFRTRMKYAKTCNRCDKSVRGLYNRKEETIIEEARI